MHHPVIARAEALSRRIYASFPWGYRVANLFLKLASGYIDAFGRLVYAEMIKAGVTDMPPINGESAESYADKVQGPRGPDKLPRGYGSEFGKRIYAFLMSKTHNIETTEEVMSRMMMDIARGKIRFQGGFDLKQSEALLYKTALRTVLDIKREQKGRNNDRLTPESLTDDMGETIDLSDPSAFKHLDGMIPQSEVHRIVDELSKLDPRAVEWFEGKLEGLKNKEMAAQWGVSEPRFIQIENLVEPLVKQILMKYLRDAA